MKTKKTLIRSGLQKHEKYDFGIIFFHLYPFLLIVPCLFKSLRKFKSLSEIFIRRSLIALSVMIFGEKFVIIMVTSVMEDGQMCRKGSQEGKCVIFTTILIA